MTNSADREFDLILVGATGFTGRLTARHLADHAPDGLRVALAGRSIDRLAGVRAELSDAAADWPLLALDTRDTVAVADLAARTRVVITAVGPYGTYGMPLAQACAGAGTHYADLTGEVLFVHDSIEANHAVAQQTGARIVHACGFDSVPSDLAVLLVAEAARADGADLGTTRLAVRRLSVKPSGGTVATARNLAMAMREDPAARAIVNDPWALADGGRPPRDPKNKRPARGGLAGLIDVARRANPVRRDPDNDHFTGPFVMAGFNTRIVARSASLLHYGDRFRYSEYSDFGPRPSGAARATAMSVGLAAVLGGMSFGPSRALLDRLLPEPGEGPSEESMLAGKFRFEVTGEGSKGRRYRSVAAAPFDPGYLGAGIMLAQSGLALADGENLPETPGGVLTPATGIGAPLVERLREHGFILALDPTF